MFHRGKFVLVLILALGLGAALFAAWFRYTRGRRTIERWGADVVVLVRDAPVVELLKLPETGPKDAVDISHARGLVHLRYALMQDASYQWSEPPAADARPQYALRFARGADPAEFQLDLEKRVVSLAGRDRSVVLAPHLANGLRQFIGEILQSREAAPSRSSD